MCDIIDNTQRVDWASQQSTVTKYKEVYRIHIFSSFKISNKNILKNILEI